MVKGRDDHLQPQSQQQKQSIPCGLIVGNYCHDVLIRDGVVVAESLGGAASFISGVLDGVSIPCGSISKVGGDFAYSTSHSPIVVANSKTTLFHAHFDSEIGEEDKHRDRTLKRVCACEPIRASDLPETGFDFGMAVGVGGEMLPETLERMFEICNVVFVDIQALIRVFDNVDGTVKLAGLKESGFYHLLPRIGFIKASAEEALYMDVEEVRKWCCVVVTSGKNGCNILWKDGELQIAPFMANQVDPTGAGDSFLGGFAAGLVQGLAVPDAALLGNFFGSVTVGHIGLPKFDLRLLQRVKDEVQRRKAQYIVYNERKDDVLKFVKPAGFDQFHDSLSSAKLIHTTSVEKCQWNLSNPLSAVNGGVSKYDNGQSNFLRNSMYEEPIQTGNP